MSQVVQGTVTVTIPDTISIPDKAGSLSPDEMRRLPKARRGIGVACENTADAMRKNPDRLRPHNVEADSLETAGNMAEEIDTVIVDLEALVVKLKQANTLLDADAHEQLRKVLAFVRSQEKFDARLTDLVPHLIAYFANERPPKDDTPPTAK